MMPPGHIAFFAGLDEQAKWLSGVASTWDGWCAWPDEDAKDIVIRPLAEAARLLTVSEKVPQRIFLGRADLARPVWRLGGAGRSLDLTESQAVQLVPAVRRGGILLEGRLDMMRPFNRVADDRRYRETREWFRKLRRSLVAAWDISGFHVRIRSTSGATRLAGGRVVVSPAALESYRKGGVMKQFEEATLSFEVRREADADSH